MASIINGLFSGRAGIQSHGGAISVIADNIANSNTVGFKASRPEFSDLIAGNISGSGGGTTVGSGSNLSGVTAIFNQGTFEFTGRALDLAIDGNGFYISEDASGARFYSRAGNFQIDADGNLLNQNGQNVQGFLTGGSGGLQPLNVNERSVSNIGTTEVTIGGNLDTTSATAAVPGAGSTFAQLNSAAQFSTFLDVFDSLGAEHSVTVYYFHTASGTWQANAYVDGSDITGGTAGIPSLLGTGATMTFDSSGQLTTPASFSATPAWSNGASATAMSFSFSPYTQFAAPSSINAITQNGTGGGSVVSFQVDEDGVLAAQLDNGQRANIGQIALAAFANPEGLARRSGTLFIETSTSGQPVVGTANTGQFGGIQSEAIELSTTDMAGDFVKLISLQRGFQGSSRMITSINDLLNEIVNLI